MRAQTNIDMVAKHNEQRQLHGKGRTGYYIECHCERASRKGTPGTGGVSEHNGLWCPLPSKWARTVPRTVCGAHYPALCPYSAQNGNTVRGRTREEETLLRSTNKAAEPHGKGRREEETLSPSTNKAAQTTRNATERGREEEKKKGREEETLLSSVELCQQRTLFRLRIDFAFNLKKMETFQLHFQRCGNFSILRKKEATYLSLVHCYPHQLGPGGTWYLLKNPSNFGLKG